MVISSTDEQSAIQACIEKLKEVPVMLAVFITDITENKHKKWKMFKAELSKVLSIGFKGRAKHIRPFKPKYGLQAKVGAAYLREKHGVGYIPQLHLDKCQTETDKAKVILASDCNPQIQADLLSVLKL